MAFNIPGVIINLFFAWLWIQYLFMGLKGQRYILYILNISNMKQE
jgi:hypothetical protein